MTMTFGYHIYFEDFDDELIIIEPLNTVFKINNDDRRKLSLVSRPEYFRLLNRFKIDDINPIKADSKSGLLRDGRFLLWQEKSLAINANMKYLYSPVIKQGFLDVPVPANSRSLFYLFHDGQPKFIQSYEYFWDDDPKFQKVFRDDMGGNHQWLLMWANAGGRSGYADIVEFWVPNITVPVLHWYMENKPKKLLELLSDAPKRSIPEFNKRSQYLEKRWKHHIDNEEDEKDAFNMAMEDLKKATNRKDPQVYYQEYENMGFDHPRPDYLDEKYM